MTMKTLLRYLERHYGHRMQKTLRNLGYEIRRYYNPYGFENGDISPGQQKLILSRVSTPLVLLGSQAALRTYAFLGTSQIDWSWDPDVALPDNGQVVVCDLALSDKRWDVMRGYPSRCMRLLVKPTGVITLRAL